MALPPGYSRLPQRKPGSNLGSIPGDIAALPVDWYPWTPHQLRGGLCACFWKPTGPQTAESRAGSALIVPISMATGQPFSGVLELLKVLEELA
jgi:hypothetical protein